MEENTNWEQSVTGDLRVNGILKQVGQDCIRIFGGNLVGVYVHGSVAFGCFLWENSDIDLLVVTKEAPPLSEKEAFLCALLKLDARCPKKGLEMSLVLEKDCRDFVYPTPFELHFSNAHKAGLFVGEADGAGTYGVQSGHGSRAERLVSAAAVREYCRRMNGTDKDLAAHFTVLRAVGITLCGKEIAEVFGEVPCAAYLDSIREDVSGAEDEIAGNPVYVVLNLCRVLAFLKEGLVCSKEQGGQWALRNLPGDFAGRAVVERAAECYRTGEEFFSGFNADLSAVGLKVFAGDMLAKIRRTREDGDLRDAETGGRMV